MQPVHRLVCVAEQQRVDRGLVVPGADGQVSARPGTIVCGGVIGQHPGGTAGAGRRRRAGPVRQFLPDAGVVGLHRRGPARGPLQRLAWGEDVQPTSDRAAAAMVSMEAAGSGWVADRPPVGVPDGDCLGEMGRDLGRRGRASHRQCGE
jgi:hypothetical protein